MIFINVLKNQFWPDLHETEQFQLDSKVFSYKYLKIPVLHKNQS